MGEETEPDDEDMVELHIIESDDIKREKGRFTRDKLNSFLKNVVELQEGFFKLKPKVRTLYSMDSMTVSDVFVEPEPQFEESIRKTPGVQMSKNKKGGQCTLDGWATATNAKSGKKDGKETKDPKDPKDPKEPKDPKDPKEPKEGKVKEGP